MDKSEVKKFSLMGGGGFIRFKRQSCSSNCLKWINLKWQKIFPYPGMRAGLFCHKFFYFRFIRCSGNCLSNLDKFKGRKFSPPQDEGRAFLTADFPKLLRQLPEQLWINLKAEKPPPPHGWGKIFCHKNQSCSRLPESDKSEGKKFSSNWGAGLLWQKSQSSPPLDERDKFLTSKDLSVSGNFKQLWFCGRKAPPIWGKNFLTTKTKVAQNCLKRIFLKSKKFGPSSCGRKLFCHKNPRCLKFFWPQIYPKSKAFSSILGGGAFLWQRPKLLEIAPHG